MVHIPFISRGAEATLDALGKSQAIIEFEPDGKIIRANENFLRVMGYRLDEIRGRHHSMFAEPGFANSSEYRNFWNDLGNGQFKAAEYKRLGKGGKEIWLEASYNPVRGSGGGVVKVVKFATDITDKKKLATEMKGMVDAISRSQAVIEFNLDGSIITANENFLSVMGYRLEEVKGKHHSIFVEESFRNSSEYRHFWERLNKGEFQAAQYKRIGKGGKEIWIEASYNPIIDPNGKPYKVVKFATDLTKRKEENLKLADQFERDVKGLVDTVSASATELQSTAESLTMGADRTNERSATGAAATEQLTASIGEISKQLSNAVEATSIAVGEAQKSSELVASLVERVNQIGSVTAVITDIAEQTNLLALNATIEAARAGDAGKGFSVVASEVKALATQTAKATAEISEQISTVQSSTQTTAKSIQEIALTIEKVNEISMAISGAVEEQNAATNEVSSNIVGVKEAAVESKQSASEVLDAAAALAKYSVNLQDQVTKFIATVRSM
ncbi:MAG: PAS domain-containing methyl-accepting chemotaxis protein [Rhodobacteraceae bacterium]|nr:PAS domain-containing methyl-accepting chemotaxis protein [Paracoccaceae bacterium]